MRRNHSDMFAFCEPIIRDYVNTCIAEEKKITNRTQLIKALWKHFETPENTFHPSLSTIDRYLNKMGFVFRSSTDYEFRLNTRSLDRFISYFGFCNHICFLLTKPSLGMFMAKTINNYYYSCDTDFEGYIHCVAIENLLICFYDEEIFNKDDLIDEILELLNHYYLDNIKKKT